MASFFFVYVYVVLRVIMCEFDVCVSILLRLMYLFGGVQLSVVFIA